MKRWGKSPPRGWQQARHGKPHREQCQIGTACGHGRDQPIPPQAALARRSGLAARGALATRHQDEWPSRGGNPLDRIRLTGPPRFSVQGPLIGSIAAAQGLGRRPPWAVAIWIPSPCGSFGLGRNKARSTTGGRHPAVWPSRSSVFRGGPAMRGGSALFPRSGEIRNVLSGLKLPKFTSFWRNPHPTGPAPYSRSGFGTAR